MNFVHLHTHSHYSLLDGLAKIDHLVGKAKKYGMKALALTDHESLYGAIEFYQACTARGIKPIIGIETYITSRGRHKKNGKQDDERFHLILLAQNSEGYHNLLTLITKSHIEGFYYKPRIDFELLEQHSNGLIATSACLNGQISQAILKGNDPVPIVNRYYEIFGKDRFYLEVQYHPHLPAQDTVNNALIKLSRQHTIPLVATADSHYLDPEDAEAHDVLLCLQTKKIKTDTDRMCMLGEDFSFSDGSSIIDHFSGIPDAIENTVRIADMCSLSLAFGNSVMPYFEVPPSITHEEYLRALCRDGMHYRYGRNPVTKELTDRLEYELKIIINAGFASYFLIVHDFIAWAKKQGIVVGPGRGSAAGSIVSYVLGITNIDPITYDLLFERFLNPERISMPDIDLDFADTRRDEVLSYVEKKYGSDHVAQIITFGTMAARVSIRDVGRVLDFPYTFCDSLAKLFPANCTIQKAVETVPEIGQMYATEPKAQKIIDIAKKLEGVARHTSTHACGVVITKEPLTNYVPCQYVSPEDKRLVTQYSLHAIEDLGLLKIDFLGLSNLTILEHAKNIVAREQGISIDYDSMPLTDAKTFRLLQEGKTTGIFQLESAGMKRYLRMLRPTEIEDIIAMVALYRPGPMEWIPDYIDRKHGRKKPTYVNDRLRPILEKTYGIAIYQEQVMKIAQELAGFSLGEADVLRKAVGKKIKKLLKQQREKFIQGAVAGGISQAAATDIFNFIEPFAGYGFNRSHAACYALIAYQTAYMKAHYPAEFMAALLTADQGDSDRIALEIEECRSIHMSVLPPDINESFDTFTVVKGSQEDEYAKIRFGLVAIKNLGAQVVAKIVEERSVNGPYRSLEEFISRLPGSEINKKSLESLIKSGALDRFGERDTLYYNIDALLDFHRKIQTESSTKQGKLFMDSMLTPALVLSYMPASAHSPKVYLAWEKELLGLYLTEHPLRSIEQTMKHFVQPCEAVRKLPEHTVVKMCGVVTTVKKIRTKQNEPMLFAKIEDMSGSIEVIVFPSLYKTTEELWQADLILAIEGRISSKDEDNKILCSRVRLVDDEFMAALCRTLQEKTRIPSPVVV